MNTVYSIKCLLSNKYYVGASGNFLARKSRHIRDLKKNKHHSSKLQNAWNKYGVNNFVFEIIENVADYSLLEEREQFWIDTLDSYFNGYNSYQYARPCLMGDKHGMFRKSPKNKGVTSPHRRKSITSYNLFDGTVETFDAVKIAAEFFGPQFLSCITLEKINKTRCRKFKNRFWFYTQDFNLAELKVRFNLLSVNSLKGRKRPKDVCLKISKSLTGQKLSPDRIKKMSLSKLGTGVKKIIRNDGVVFDSIKEASLVSGIERSRISHNLRGRQKKCGQFSFQYF